MSDETSKASAALASCDKILADPTTKEEAKGYVIAARAEIEAYLVDYDVHRVRKAAALIAEGMLVQFGE